MHTKSLKRIVVFEVTCPQGHKIITKKKTDIQCFQCAIQGIRKRFDRI